MKERPILFSAEMVRAILEGRKTQTRRVIKLPKDRGVWEPSTVGGGGTFRIGKSGQKIPVPEMACIWNTTTGKTLISPYGQPGSRLWVRECFRPALSDSHECFSYKADYKYQCGKAMPEGPKGFLKWKPSIHMPRRASRITLEITGIHVERLNEISEGDCWDEGLEAWLANDKNLPKYEDGTPGKYISEKHAFRALWESVNGPESWAANPFVWVIEFRRIKT